MESGVSDCASSFSIITNLTLNGAVKLQNYLSKRDNQTKEDFMHYCSGGSYIDNCENSLSMLFSLLTDTPSTENCSLLPRLYESSPKLNDKMTYTF